MGQASEYSPDEVLVYCNVVSLVYVRFSVYESQL